MIPEFFAIVDEMRKAQKKAKKSRMSYDIDAAEELAKQVDDYIKNYCEENKNVEQKSLFS